MFSNSIFDISRGSLLVYILRVVLVFPAIYERERY